jgi:hypothetical protein
MVAGLAFAATAVATVFAQATGVRWSRSRAPHQGAWTVSLAMFALASAALATGEATGWDDGTFRVYYLLGAILTVPWLALGTVYLMLGRVVGNRIRAGLLVFSGLAAGVMLATTINPPVAQFGGIPVGKDHLEALPRALAGAASGVGALVVFAGAVWSAARYARKPRDARAGSLVAGNVCIALGVLILSSGGLLQGVVGHDESFAISLTTGISVIYVGFVVASGWRPRWPSARRNTLPASVRGSASTTSTRVGSL